MSWNGVRRGRCWRIYALGCPVRGGPIRLYRDSLVAPGSTRAALEPAQMSDGVDGLDPLGVAYAHRALASGVSDGGGAVVGDAFILPAGGGPALRLALVVMGQRKTCSRRESDYGDAPFGVAVMCGAAGQAPLWPAPGNRSRDTAHCSSRVRQQNCSGRCPM